MNARFSGDPHRPAYHFLPPSNWLNDPNGLIHWRGEYHLFYQYNPNGAFHGTIHWGHAVSSDLVHWRDLPIALAPTPGTYDQDGIWSGCAVDDNGVPTILYTGVRGSEQLPCVAISHDGLVTWEKDAHNPVIAAPPPEITPPEMRDHTVWREGGMWYQGIGTSKHGVGCVLLYRSPDLRAWEYLGPLLTGDVSTGAFWECPDFFSLGDRHVLIIAPIPFQRAIYFSGRYVDHRFSPEVQGEIDLGGCLYAPQSFTDASGRRIMIGWLWEERSKEIQRDAGWAGIMSLPRVLTLSPSGALVQTPAPELVALRGAHQHFDQIAVGAGSRETPDGLQGDQVELIASFDIGSAEQCGLAVRRSPDGAEETLIFYDRTAGALVIDRKQSSLAHDINLDRRSCPIHLAADELLTLRIFLDHSVIEVFVGDHACLATRVYPSRSDSIAIVPIASGGDAVMTACDIWEMRTIWSETRSEVA